MLTFVCPLSKILAFYQKLLDKISFLLLWPYLITLFCMFTVFVLVDSYIAYEVYHDCVFHIKMQQLNL